MKLPFQNKAHPTTACTGRGAVARAGDSLSSPSRFPRLDLARVPSRAADAERWVLVAIQRIMHAQDPKLWVQTMPGRRQFSQWNYLFQATP